VQTDYDFIIVGGGSAGCVLADRLTEDGRHRVLLLESGGTHRRFFVDMPLGFGQCFFDRSLNWCYTTQPDQRLGGRADYWPRGRILGGSGSINAMVYIRGQREDYDEWARLGNPGWGFDDVLPYFKKSEDNDAGADALHGTGGPLCVSSIKGREHPVVRAALDSAMALGYPDNPDFNGPRQEGVGLYQFNFRNGRRSSSATGSLARAMRRANLVVETGADVERVLFEGRRAIGVAYRRKDDAYQARARREVLLSAGAINSPMLLQHSGIGSGALLQRLGIPLVHDLPAVGENLQDHAQCGMAFRMKVPTINDKLRPYLGRLIAGMQYVFARRGLLGLSINQGGAFLRTRSDETRPDTQLYFLPMSFQQVRSSSAASLQVDRFSGMAINVSPCRPESRGRLAIASADPAAPPLIYPNFLATENDMRVMLDSLKIVLKIAATKPLADLIAARERPAGALALDADLRSHALATCKTTYHAASTCTMGPDPSRAVVDSCLRVHGVERLRVVDASIMPLMVSGNINAAATMIGEKGADLVLADCGLGLR